MKYELALKLKEAGFPQNEHLIPAQADRVGQNWYAPKHLVMDEPELVEGIGSENCKKRAAYCFALQYLESEKGKALTVYIPPLEELIEACGKPFTLEIWNERAWQAYNGSTYSESILKANGSTPTEAVANLYLALNSK